MVDTDRQRTDGRRHYGYTISSSCEPNGSDELIMKRRANNEKKGYSYNLVMLKTYLIIYIMAELKNIPIMPAHSRKIVCLYKFTALVRA